MTYNANHNNGWETQEEETNKQKQTTNQQLEELGNGVLRARACACRVADRTPRTQTTDITTIPPTPSASNMWWLELIS